MDREMTANQIATMMGTGLRTIQDRIRDGRIPGRINHINGRMWASVGACVGYIRRQCGDGSEMEIEFLRKLGESSK